MKIYLLFVVLVPSFATKEYSDDISQLLDNPDLILELVKRLGSDKASSEPQNKHFPDKHLKDPYVPVVHGDSRTCKTRLFKKTIIRTEDSKKEGASFLGSAENVETNAKCLQKCCSTRGCDLAVYENKTKHNCYMFKCRSDKTGKSQCKFDTHSDYMSTTLSSIEEDNSHEATVSDNDHGKDEKSLGADLEKVTEQSRPAPAQPKPTPIPTQLPHSVALGRWCQLDMSCEDPHAVCFQGVCHCQQSYYQKNGFCREVCLRDQVECKRRGTARVGPDCIPKSQVCDGTTQCADGSDEKECKTGYPDGGPSPGYTSPHDNWNDKPNQLEGGLMSGASDSSQKGDKDMSKPTEVKTDSSDSKDSGQLSGPVVNVNTDSKQAANENTDNIQVTNENIHDKQKANENTDNEAPKQIETNKDNSQEKGAGKEKATENESGMGSEHASADLKTTPQPEQNPEVEVVNKEEETMFLTKEKVIVASPTDNAQGPIVALSLGLAITLMLLVFVGCRLRNVRHRLRKGRPLHSNEADYLINGMYL